MKFYFKTITCADTVDLVNPGNNCSRCQALNHLKIYKVPKVIMF